MDPHLVFPPTNQLTSIPDLVAGNALPIAFKFVILNLWGVLVGEVHQKVEQKLAS